MSTEEQELRQLASEIMDAHKGALGASRTALGRARHAGDLLQRAKTLVKHGEWLPWLVANCDVAPTTAQEYMRIARNWPRLEEYRNARPTVYLDITKALGLVANNFVAEAQDPDEANVAELAPGGNDDEMPEDDLAPVLVTRAEQLQKLELTFTVASLERFRKQVSALAEAWDIQVGVESERVRAVVSYAYYHEHPDERHEDDSADRRQPTA